MCVCTYIYIYERVLGTKYVLCPSGRWAERNARKPPSDHRHETLRKSRPSWAEYSQRLSHVVHSPTSNN